MSDCFIHEKAIVESPFIGEKSRIWAFVHILPGARIGKGANICDGCFIENDVMIGDNVTVKCGVYIWDGITIEDNVQIGPAVVFTNDLYPRAKNRNYQRALTLLKYGSSIGANATLLCGLVIGRFALVGAGAVVVGDVPDHAIVVGNPARAIGYACICGQRLQKTDQTLRCQACGKEYVMKNKRLVAMG